MTLNSLNQSLTTNTPEVSRTASFWGTWRWWLPPAVIALALVLYFVDPFIGDWDGLDYTVLSLTPLADQSTPDLTAKGFLGTELGPAWKADSYLVPTADQDRGR